MFAFSGISLCLHFYLHTHTSFIFPFCMLELHARVALACRSLGTFRCPATMSQYVHLCLGMFTFWSWITCTASMWVLHAGFHFGPGRNVIHALFSFLWAKDQNVVNAIWLVLGCHSDLYHTSHEFGGWLLSASWVSSLGAFLSLHNKNKM